MNSIRINGYVYNLDVFLGISELRKDQYERVFMYNNQKYPLKIPKDLLYYLDFTIKFLNGNSFTFDIKYPLISFEPIETYSERACEVIKEHNKIVEKQYNELFELVTKAKPLDVPTFNF